MKQRIEALDLARSLCILLMLVYHWLYDMAIFGALDFSAVHSFWCETMKYICCCGFILVSGMTARYSRDIVKRGFLVFCVGLAVAVVTAAVKRPVAFGILQFFGVAMMLYGVFGKYAEWARGAAFPLGCAALFALTLYLTKTASVSVRWLYPLGFVYPGFYSADYYPLLPWIFLYAAGAYLGRLVWENRGAPRLAKKFPAALTFPGRHSLLIYVLHQPVLYGLCALLWGGK